MSLITSTSSSRLIKSSYEPCRRFNEQTTRKRLQAFLTQKIKNDRDPHEPLGDDYSPQHATYMPAAKTSIEQFYRAKLARSARLDETSLVIDFRNASAFKSYEELRRLGVGVTNALHANRTSVCPFQVHFANYDPASEFNVACADALDLDRNLVFVSNETYLKRFPKDRLVYVSMHGNAKMTQFDPNRVYVLNCSFKDSLGHNGYAQARKDGISCQRLPLHDYDEY